MTITALCIGGPKDGQVTTARDGDKFLAYDDALLASRGGGVGGDTRDLPSPHEYRREWITTPTGQLSLWVHSSLDASEAMQALVAGYRPAEDRRGV